MNIPSVNKWVKAGYAYKASPEEKSWDVLRVRLENKRLKKNIVSLWRWSAAAVLLGILSTAVFIYSHNTGNEISTAFALQSLDMSEKENPGTSAGSNIYNMVELKSLRQIYDTHGSEDHL